MRPQLDTITAQCLGAIVSASRMPGIARIGSMLMKGFEGQITIALLSDGRR